LVRLTGLLLLAGCASLLGPAVVRWADPPARKRAAPTLPRRDDCLKPPYVLPPGQALTVHGFRAEARGDGPRELTLTSLAGAPLEADGLIELKDRNDAAFRAIDGVEHVGLSGCPGAQGKPVPCVSLSLQLCAEPIDALAEALAGILARDTQARGRQVVVHVALLGAVAPRCEADDPRCRPDAYESAFYRQGDRRGLITAPPADADPECSWDGECGKSACGGDCLPWTTAHQPGACEANPALSSAFCGCVEHRCAWFVQ
jgi:hypothetical protein